MMEIPKYTTVDINAPLLGCEELPFTSIYILPKFPMRLVGENSIPKLEPAELCFPSHVVVQVKCAVHLWQQHALPATPKRRYVGQHWKGRSTGTQHSTLWSGLLGEKLSISCVPMTAPTAVVHLSAGRWCLSYDINRLRSSLLLLATTRQGPLRNTMGRCTMRQNHKNSIRLTTCLKGVHKILVD